MLKSLAKRALRPLWRRLAARIETIAAQQLAGATQPMRAEVQAFRGETQGLLAETQALRAEVEFFRTEAQTLRTELGTARARLERIAIDAYFGGFASSGRTPQSRLVQLRAPDAGVELEIAGPAADRSILGPIEASGGTYEPHLIACLAKRLPDDAVCIDIGANLGAIALQLSSIANRGHIYAFEPAKASFDYLVGNIRANDVRNVTPINLGLGNGTTEAVLNYLEDLSGCSFVEVEGIEIAESARAIRETVRLTSLDQWQRDNGIERIDFIKLDAEGMEQLVLDGARKLLESNPPDLAIEFNPRTSDEFGHGSSEGLYRLLASHWDTILIIPTDMGALIPVASFGELMDYTQKGRGWEDLYCTNAKPRV